MYYFQFYSTCKKKYEKRTQKKQTKRNKGHLICGRGESVISAVLTLLCPLDDDDDGRGGRGEPTAQREWGGRRR